MSNNTFKTKVFGIACVSFCYKIEFSGKHFFLFTKIFCIIHCECTEFPYTEENGFTIDVVGTFYLHLSFFLQSARTPLGDPLAAPPPSASRFGTAAAVIYGQQVAAVSADIMQSSADVSTTAALPAPRRAPPLMHGSHLKFPARRHPTLSRCSASGKCKARLHLEIFMPVYSYMGMYYRSRMATSSALSFSGDLFRLGIGDDLLPGAGIYIYLIVSPLL